jgi:hypothetical protein
MGPTESRKLVKTINSSLCFIGQLQKKILLTPIIILMDLKEDIGTSLSSMSQYPSIFVKSGFADGSWRKMAFEDKITH